MKPGRILQVCLSRFIPRNWVHWLLSEGKGSRGVCVHDAAKLSAGRVVALAVGLERTKLAIAHVRIACGEISRKITL